MSMSTASDFPIPDEHGTTRVPNAVLASMLAAPIDADLIAFSLRALWWLERSSAYPKAVQLTDLRTDRTLVEVLGQPFGDLLAQSLRRGYFVTHTAGGTEYLLLNTASVARSDDPVTTAPASTNGNADASADADADPWGSVSERPTTPDAFRAYEQNIGRLTPMIRDSIKQALQDFTDAQIEDAIRIAVENEARSWQFVAGVLRKWTRDGIPDERHTATEPGGARLSEDQLRKYLERQRKLQRRE